MYGLVYCGFADTFFWLRKFLLELTHQPIATHFVIWIRDGSFERALDTVRRPVPIEPLKFLFHAFHHMVHEYPRVRITGNKLGFVTAEKTFVFTKPSIIHDRTSRYGRNIPNAIFVYANVSTPRIVRNGMKLTKIGTVYRRFGTRNNLAPV